MINPRPVTPVKGKPARTRFRRIHAIPHFHFDLEWWKSEPGYACDVADIMDAAMDMLDAHPEFTFVLDQATAIKPWWDARPEKREALRAHIRAGRVECVGGTWAAPDENIPTGEALIRNFLAGREFFENELGARVNTAWEIDEFGHPAQMPQIFSGCGFSQFVFARGVPMNRHEDHPADFVWKAPDGSGILTHWLSAHYTGLVPLFNPLINRYLFMRELRGRMALQAAQAQSDNMFLPLGTDFQVPDAQWLDFISEWNGTETAKMQLSLPDRYFRDLRAAAGDALPRIAGEFNPLLTGCYESREKIKRGCRAAQHAILEAEKLAAICHASGWIPWPVKKFRIAWDNILKNDFHDTICGTGTDAVYRDSLKRYDEAMELVGGIRDGALGVIARRAPVTGKGCNILVFNSLNHEREETVCATLDAKTINGLKTGKIKHLAAFGPDGRAAPVQVCGGRALFRAAAPQLGYAVYRIAPISGKNYEKLGNPFKIQGLCFENGLVRISFDERTGALESLYHIAGGREALDTADERLGNGLVVEEDAGNLWTVQKTGRVWCDRDFPAPEIRVAESGPVRLVVEVSGAHRGLHARRRIILNANSPRVDFVTHIDFTGRDLRVKARFPAAGATRAVFETPFCATERGDGHHCAQNWVDMETDGCGLALFNSGNPGHDAQGNILDIVLMRSVSAFPARKIARFVKNNLPELRRSLRQAWRHTVQGLGVSLGEWDLYEFHGLMLREWSSAGPSPDSRGRMNLLDHLRPLLDADRPADCWERGAHSFRYAALPHSGGFSDAALPLQALAFNTPMTCAIVKKTTGELPARHSFLQTGGDPAVLLTALKLRETGGALIARVYDAHGRGAHGKFTTALPVKAPRPVNMVEQPAPGAPAPGRSFSLDPWRIATYELDMRRAKATGA